MDAERRFTCPKCGGHDLIGAHAGDMDKAWWWCNSFPCKFKVRGAAIDAHMTPLFIHDAAKAD
jgi:hypothetical protein